jgi:hypothetical protein
MTHILILVAIIALLIVIAEHSRLASRVATAETKLKAIDTKIAAALRDDAKAVVSDVKTVESAVEKAL